MFNWKVLKFLSATAYSDGFAVEEVVTCALSVVFSEKQATRFAWSNEPISLDSLSRLRFLVALDEQLKADLASIWHTQFDGYRHSELCDVLRNHLSAQAGVIYKAPGARSRLRKVFGFLRAGRMAK